MMALRLDLIWARRQLSANFPAFILPVRRDGSDIFKGVAGCPIESGSWGGTDPGGFHCSASDVAADDEGFAGRETLVELGSGQPEAQRCQMRETEDGAVGVHSMYSRCLLSMLLDMRQLTAGEMPRPLHRLDSWRAE